MTAHYSDVRRLVLTGKKSDSFAAHFANLFNTDYTDSKPTPRKDNILYLMARESTLSTKILRY